MSVISFFGTLAGLAQTIQVFMDPGDNNIVIPMILTIMFLALTILFSQSKKEFVDLYTVCSSVALNNRLQTLRELVMIQHREMMIKNHRYKINKAKFEYKLTQSKTDKMSYDLHYDISLDLTRPYLMRKTTKNRTLRFFAITLAAGPSNLKAKFRDVSSSSGRCGHDDSVSVICVAKDCTTRGESGSNEKIYSGVYEFIVVLPDGYEKKNCINLTVSYDIFGQIKKDQGKHSFTIIPLNYGYKISELEVRVYTEDVKIRELEFQRFGVNGEFEIPALFEPVRETPAAGNIQKFYSSIKPMKNSVYSVQFVLPEKYVKRVMGCSGRKARMYTYRRATVDDIPQLIKFRMNLLRSAVGPGKKDKWDLVEQQLEDYYKSAIPSEEHIAYLAFDGNVCIGTGGVCFYRVLPTYFKPTGKKAYIINMYTKEEYRRQGVATEILDRLVRKALERKATYISLEATNEGRPVYEKYGFGPLNSEMQYKNETYEG